MDNNKKETQVSFVPLVFFMIIIMIFAGSAESKRNQTHEVEVSAKIISQQYDGKYWTMTVEYGKQYTTRQISGTIMDKSKTSARVVLWENQDGTIKKVTFRRYE